MNLVQRLEALEASQAAARLRAKEGMPKTPAERAQAVHDLLWTTRIFDDRYRVIAPEGDGYWPYLPGGYGAAALLQVNALEVMFAATGDEALGLILSMAEGCRPLEGGEASLYYEEGDDVPLIRFWFEPVQGSDLL